MHDIQALLAPCRSIREGAAQALGAVGVLLGGGGGQLAALRGIGLFVVAVVALAAAIGGSRASLAKVRGGSTENFLPTGGARSNTRETVLGCTSPRVMS